MIRFHSSTIKITRWCCSCLATVYKWKIIFFSAMMQLGRFLVNEWISQLIFVKSVLCVCTLFKKMMQCWRKQTESFNPFSNVKCYRLDQTDRVCTRQFSIRWKWHKLLLQARTHCVKRINSSLGAIPPFPQCFPKTYAADTWKLGVVWERVNCDF